MLHPTHCAQQESCIPGDNSPPPAVKPQQDAHTSVPGELAPAEGPDAELRRQILAHHARIQVHAHMFIPCVQTDVIFLRCFESPLNVSAWPTQGVEQQLRAVVAHEDAHHFEAQLDELSKGRQKHADMLADMAETCAASLSEVHVL